MASAAEDLMIRIDATTEQLRRELKRADKAVETRTQRMEKRIRAFQKSFKQSAAAAAKWGAGVAAAATAATTALVKAGLESVDALAKTSDKLGIATEQLARYRMAAEETGVSQKTFDTALQRMTRRLADAAEGSGPAVKALKTLGLEASQLVKLSPDKALGKIADKMKLVDNQSKRVSLAFKLFDSEGVGLVNTLKLGSEGLEALGKNADIAGLAISRVDAAKVEAANDAMGRVKALIKGLSQQLAVKFAPLLKLVADRFFKAGEEAGGMSEVATKAFDYVIRGAGFVRKAVAGIQVAWLSWQNVSQKVALAIASSMEKLAKNAVDIYNKIPFLDKAKYSEGLSGFTASMTAAASETQAKIDAILAKDYSISGLEKYVHRTGRLMEQQSQIAAKSSADLQKHVSETEQTANRMTAASSGAAKKVNGDFERVLESLKTNEERIQAQYERSRQLILQNTVDASAYQTQLLAKLDAQLAERLASIREKTLPSNDDVSLSDGKELSDKIFGPGAIDQFLSELDDIDDAFDNLLKNMAKNIIKRGANKFLDNLFNNDGGSGFSFGNFFSSMFKQGGAYASGGHPPVGKVSLVGEAGPELIVPRQPSTVIPNHALGGNSVTVNMNIGQGADADSFMRSRGQIESQMAAAVQRAARNQ